ncbi:MAG: cytochrome D1 domain-containing protein [Chitinophagaceae bacterium]
MSLRQKLGIAFTLVGCVLVAGACRHQISTPREVTLDDGGYPPEINKIVMLHCTSGPTGGGCHNEVGAQNAAGFNMDTWAHAFEGSNHGSVIIPYDTINTPLLYYISPDSALGPMALPGMPYTGTNTSQTPLTADEYKTIRHWVAQGAPDKDGNIAFGSNPDTRQKIYMTEQGSDVLSVVDAASHLVMRSINIGMTPAIEGAHCVRVSEDGRYAYLCFLHGDYVQKVDTRTDQIVGSVKISNGDASWNVLHISPDGSRLIVSDFLGGKIDFINTANMEVTKVIPTSIPNLHGIASTRGFDTFFVTVQYGNTVFKLFPNFSYKLVTIDGATSTFAPQTRDPHEILMAPDYSKYFLTCEASNEIRVMDPTYDTLIAVIPVPQKPQEMSISKVEPYLFVSCMEAKSTTPGAYGAVAVINYQTLQLVKIIYGDFWQPHGLSVDDQNGVLYVASTNQTGPSVGHNHTSGGKHGWYNIYSLQTLEPINTTQYETLVLPYSTDTRFK